MGQRMAGRAHGAEEIDPELQAPFRISELLERAAHAHACVRHDDIQPAELFDDAGDRIIHGTIIRDITGNSEPLLAGSLDLRNDGGELVRTAPANGDMGPLSRKLQSQCATDTAASASDPNDFIVEDSHTLVLS